MNPTCSHCRVVFWKDPGEGLGAMYLDYVVAFGIFLVLWPTLVLTTNLSDLAQFFLLSAVSVAAVLIWRYGRIEERWSARLQRGPENAVDQAS